MRLVVVGASLAGLRSVEAARRLGFQGEIVLVGDERHLPYNRPPLSKGFLVGDERLDTIAFASVDRFAELDVTLRLGERAQSLDLAARTIRVGDDRVPFDALVIATGARARHLPATLNAGRSYRNVHTLRTVDDANALRAALRPGAAVVVVGGGFIGAEVASAARKAGAGVTVVEAAPVPLVRAVGTHLGEFCASLHARNGVELITGVGVEALIARDECDAVAAVKLSDGRTLPADAVVVGVGAEPNVDWLKGSGLDIADGVVADAYLNAGHPGVYAVGDVVRWPNPGWPGTTRLESWTSVVEQAERAVANLLAPDSARPCSIVPYFWSDQYGTRLQSLGMPTEEHVEVVHGSLDEAKFVALYRDGDTISGAFAAACPHLIMKLRPLIQRRAPWSEALAACATWSAPPAEVAV